MNDGISAATAIKNALIVVALGIPQILNLFVANISFVLATATSIGGLFIIAATLYKLRRDAVLTNHLIKKANIETLNLEIELAKKEVLLEAEKKRRTFAMWTLIISVVVIVLPLLFLPFIISSLLGSITLPEGFNF